MHNLFSIGIYMAIQHNVWGQIQRPWGYEVRVDLMPDQLPDQVFHEVLTFPSGQPTVPVLAARVVQLKQQLADRLLAARDERIAELRKRRRLAYLEYQEWRQRLMAEGEDPDGD